MNPFQKKSPPIQSSTQIDLDMLHRERTDMYIVAALMNVYNEALRRKCNRILWGERDVDRFICMTKLVLEITDETATKPPARSWDLTKTERDRVLNMFPAESNEGERTDADEGERTDEPKAKRVSVKA